MMTQDNLFSLRVNLAIVRAALAIMALGGVACAAAPAAAKAGEDDMPAKNTAETSAEDVAVAELVKPASTVEFGLGNVSQGSYKFSEYNGLQRKGPFAIGNINLEKRSPYDSADTSHFRLNANNLGLETRDATLNFGQQGRYKLSFGYDELRHNTSDSYQTPFLGAGTSNLTLPPNWQKPLVPQVNAVNINYRALSPANGDAASLTGAPTAAQLATLQGIRAADLPAFHNLSLQAKRTTYDAAFSYLLSPDWGVTASAKREYQKGVRPLGALTAFGAGGDSVAIIPELIDTTTDQFNLGVNYTGEKLFGEASYYGSLFNNSVKGMTWQDPKNPLAAGVNPTISSAPSNQFHQLTFTGGYTFGRSTKLVLNGSFGRNTQNDAFLTPSAFNSNAFQAPAPALDGLVITKTLGATLNTRPTSLWHIATSFKYNDRDNRTPVRNFLFYDGDVASNSGAAPSPFATLLGRDIGQNGNYYNNRPMSRTSNQFKFDTDYRIAKGHTLAGGYTFERVDRGCNSTWIDCSDASRMNENTLRGEWRAAFSDDVSSRVTYAHARRTVNYNSNAWLAEVPLADQIATGPVGAATVSVYNFITQSGLTGFGPLLGFPTVPLIGNAALLTPNNNIILQRYYGSRNNISEIPGMRRFNLADRERDKVRTSLNWQATERLGLQGSVDFTSDNYDHTVYGLQDAKSFALNLEGTYQIGDDFSASVFATHEQQRSAITSFPSNISNVNPATPVSNNVLSGSPCFTSVQLHNGSAKIDPCNQWSSRNHDSNNTLGLLLSRSGLLAGKLNLSGSLIYTRARSDISVKGGTYVNNPAAGSIGEPGVFYIAAEDFPTMTTHIISLGVKGDYRVDKSSAIRFMYSFSRLKSSQDYAYTGAQFGTAAAEMPTNERTPTYNVHVFGVSYQYRFQ